MKGLMDMKKKIVNAAIGGCILAALAVGQVVYSGADKQTQASKENVQVEEEAAMETAQASETDTIEDFEDEVTEEEGTVTAEDDEEIILEEEVPLSDGDKITKTTETLSKKTSTKTKTLSSKSKKSKTKKKTQVKWKKVTSTSRTAKICKKTTTTTVKETIYKKGSKKAKVKTTVTTVLETTTTVTENGEYDIAAYAKKADSKLISLFKSNGYKFIIDSSLSKTGVFSPSKKSISLAYHSDVIYHELGHYLAYVTGKSDKSTEFAAIYEEEKEDYAGSNAAYVTSTAAEYFAQSYRIYCTDSAKLKNSCPKTYEFIEDRLAEL
ncbi:hypothetical protein SAMN02910417_01602 [Eubacterium oxidoreducens]|uniref:ATLF-like domain-containing protein n=1 Tax=Eubacterium oxidoreducens TaxID=1732 RepID=A0A1G6BLF0_EUBOX|nr:hypothetical protein SAMN02910417_01602 [Eubacterium oxidoreducens]